MKAKQSILKRINYFKLLVYDSLIFKNPNSKKRTAFQIIEYFLDHSYLHLYNNSLEFNKDKHETIKDLKIGNKTFYKYIRLLENKHIIVRNKQKKHKERVTYKVNLAVFFVYLESKRVWKNELNFSKRKRELAISHKKQINSELDRIIETDNKKLKTLHCEEKMTPHVNKNLNLQKKEANKENQDPLKLIKKHFFRKYYKVEGYEYFRSLFSYSKEVKEKILKLPIIEGYLKTKVHFMTTDYEKIKSIVEPILETILKKVKKVKSKVKEFSILKFIKDLWTKDCDLMDLEDLLLSKDSIKKIKASKDAVFKYWVKFMEDNASECQRAEYALKYDLFVKNLSLNKF